MAKGGAYSRDKNTFVRTFANNEGGLYIGHTTGHTYIHARCTNFFIVGIDSVELSDGISGSWSWSLSCIEEDSGGHFSADLLASDVTDPISSLSSSDS